MTNSNSLDNLRQNIRDAHLKPEQEIIQSYLDNSGFTQPISQSASLLSAQWVTQLRHEKKHGLMELFLAQYGLSTSEGVALMCLAEAMLRTPDTKTLNELIEDKIAPSQWSKHLGRSNSHLVNASTWGLMLTGKVLDNEINIASVLKDTIKRMGEPFIRNAIKVAMKELAAQFVLGQTIGEAIKSGKKSIQRGYTYSYDMLGEAAMTATDANLYFDSYKNAIQGLKSQCTANDIRLNPGISVKLSALHPRYEESQRQRVLNELAGTTMQLIGEAQSVHMGFNIDAEESDRLELSLDIIEAILRNPELEGWDGLGVVVQAYSKRSLYVIEWLYQLASQLNRKIMVRLVKGAYWDTEIKKAQVEGIDGYPVFYQKAATDLAYLCCAKKLLEMTDRIYPQFATHNAHSMAAILEMSGEMSGSLEDFEFQRLHGMGDALHDLVMKQTKSHCRIYAPVGEHQDLLAYLVRRLLENGANSSFVNQIINENIAPNQVVADVFEQYIPSHQPLPFASEIYAPERPNSKGFDPHNLDDIAMIEIARTPYKTHQWQAEPLVVNPLSQGASTQIVTIANPATPSDVVGKLTMASDEDIVNAVVNATPWNETAEQRGAVLNLAADLYEENFGELFAVLCREAGKTMLDAIGELREAVDFLRYYAAQCISVQLPARGVFTCISPWNFPLAIFTGQLSAALATGNAVLAKPAESTSITATIAVKLLHRAGVPVSALQLIPGLGSTAGAQLTSSTNVNGVCFTGSTPTAQAINRAMASNMSPTAPLIAETGGLNAMIVDSTALPEQAIRDVVSSAFQSAGQRCSALRCMYIQQDVADDVLELLYGAMDELVLGNPWNLNTDIGPVINETARKSIQDYIDSADAQGRILKHGRSCSASGDDSQGTFIAPTVIKVDSITDIADEIFGPVLHVATYKASQINQVIKDINAKGFGLTFGMHSRIDSRIEQTISQLNVGNIYINRNQIGAVVGSQPFGGEGLSGTGPKAGGPSYLKRFVQPMRQIESTDIGKSITLDELQTLVNIASETPSTVNSASLESMDLPGPTGESNRLSYHGRGTILCLGPDALSTQQQIQIAQSQGCTTVGVAPNLEGEYCIDGSINSDYLKQLEAIDAVACFASDEQLKPLRQALASRDGKLIPLLAEQDMHQWCSHERHICIDTTAAGGNTSLLGAL